jgi:hypothetical protein
LQDKTEWKRVVFHWVKFAILCTSIWGLFEPNKAFFFLFFQSTANLLWRVIICDPPQQGALPCFKQNKCSAFPQATRLNALKRLNFSLKSSKNSQK